jgi:hypothetical protein
MGCLPPAAGAADDDAALGFERTPPRLSLVDGEVSFWRSGAADWAQGRVNTPLAAGDELYAGPESSLEIQIGSRAYVRAGERTQLGLSALEPDYLQLRVPHGTASLDLRALVAGTTFEIATPHGAFTIERTGYYRVDVNDDATRMSSRRGGWASVTTANGASALIAASEQIVITGADEPVLETYAAPPIDDWDRWNYARTDSQIEAQSYRYVPAGVYGVDDLDHYGSWRVVPTYGPVWVPRVVGGWVPYSAGDWIYDPYYGWTWVDDAPWGWAPFHYGRWVFVSGFWAWCPGPRVVRVYYAPALVAFYGTPALSISWGHHFGWVALGWGEPLVPWWGPSHWRHRPHWAGWGGPRVVNNVVVHETTVVNVTHISKYANASHKNAIVALDRGDFGRRRVHEARLTKFDTHKLRPLGDRDFGVKPSRRSLVASDRSAQHPPRGEVERRVVTTREPRRAAVPQLDPRNGRQKEREREARRSAEVPSEQPPARVVRREPSRRGQVPATRPPFGQRGEEPRVSPAPPPRFEDVRERRPVARTAPEATPAPAPEQREAPVQRGETRERREARVDEPRQPSRPQAERAERAPRERQTRSELPGEPANRVFRAERAERPQSGERTEPRERSGRERGEPTPPAGAAEQGEPRGERPGRSRESRSEREEFRDRRR